MLVSIRFFNIVRDKTGKSRDEISLPPNATVRDLLNTIKNTYGPGFRDYAFTGKGELKPYLRIMKKDRHIDLNPKEPVYPEDEFHLFGATSGG